MSALGQSIFVLGNPNHFITFHREKKKRFLHSAQGLETYLRKSLLNADQMLLSAHKHSGGTKINE